MLEKQLQNYPFDLYQRTRDIREIIDIVVRETGKKQLTILDVGGFRVDAEDRDNLLLQEFLPGHRIVTLDLTPAAAPGYVQGDGTQLPFRTGSFDIVVTSDVYEHIPPEDRETFLDNLLRVTRPDGFVILGAPFYSSRNVLAERILFEYIRKVLHAEHEQLREHIENRLPDAEELETFIKSRGCAFVSMSSGNLGSWLVMMMVKHYLLSLPDTEDLHTMLDRFYNMNFYESDHGGEGYRKVFVIARNLDDQRSDGQAPEPSLFEETAELVLKGIDAHFSEYARKHRNQRLDTPDLGHVRMLLDFEALRTRSLLDEKEATISHLAAQLETFQRMRTTRVYRVMQFFNRLFLSPFLQLGRITLGKLQQVGQVLTGKRRHPYLSVNEKAYRRWVRKHEPDPARLEQIKKELKENPPALRPRISIVMPVYNTPAQWLEKAIQSVQDQLYDNWELCIADDGSTDSHVGEILERFAGSDLRIKVARLRRNRGIAGATNRALEIASSTSQFVAFMDSDDLLHPLALLEVVRRLNQHPDTDVIYTDEDKLTVDDVRRRPEFKPDWNGDLFLTYNYINHLTVCRKKLVDEAGGFRARFDWSQDYDLYLRITEKAVRIEHIPRVLYHWREVPRSSACRVDIRPQAQAKSIELLQETLARRGINGIVTPGLRPGTFKVKKLKK